MALFVTHPTIILTAEIEADSQAEADDLVQVMVETAFTLGADRVFGSKFEVGVTDADGNFVRDEHVHVPFGDLPILDLDSFWADEEGSGVRDHGKSLVWRAHSQTTETVCVYNENECLDEVDLLRGLATHLKRAKKKNPALQVAAINMFYGGDGSLDGLNAMVWTDEVNVWACSGA